MLGNLHVRFGVGAGVKLHGLHHWLGLAQVRTMPTAQGSAANGLDVVQSGKRHSD